MRSLSPTKEGEQQVKFEGRDRFLHPIERSIITLLPNTPQEAMGSHFPDLASL